MVYKNVFLFFILVLIGYNSFSQKVMVHVFMINKKASANNDTIYYNFNRSLTWSDFRGKPDNNYFAGAVTASGFAFDSKMNFDGRNLYLDIGIYTFFTKHDSWHKPDITSAYHLLHEQHHFDITRIGAENFLEKLKKAHFTKDNYNRLLTSIFNKVYDENEAVQHQYDAETNHSINQQEQLEWNNKIAAEMQRLKENIAIKD